MPAHVDGPTHGVPHLFPRVHADTGENTLHVYGKFTILSIVSFLHGQLMKNFVLLVRLFIMVIEWHQREHEGADNEALNNLDTVNIFRQCGLLKYFQTSSMRSETSLLQLLIRYWDLDRSQFVIDDETISFEVEEIYFLTGLSCRVWELNLHG